MTSHEEELEMKSSPLEQRGHSVAYLEVVKNKVSIKVKVKLWV